MLFKIIGKYTIRKPVNHFFGWTTNQVVIEGWKQLVVCCAYTFEISFFDTNGMYFPNDVGKGEFLPKNVRQAAKLMVKQVANIDVRKSIDFRKSITDTD